VPKECDDEEDRAEYADDEGGSVAVLCNVSSVSMGCGHNHPALRTENSAECTPVHFGAPLCHVNEVQEGRTMMIGASFGPLGSGKSKVRWSAPCERRIPFVYCSLGST
jgi:hypothetical protein